MKQISLTEGSIWRVLLRFSVLFVLANLLQTLYGAVDMMGLNAYLNGCEKTLFTMINCCAGALLTRIPMMYVLMHSHVNQLAYYGLISPVSSVVMIAVIGLYMKRGAVSLRRSAVSE